MQSFLEEDAEKIAQNAKESPKSSFHVASPPPPPKEIGFKKDRHKHPAKKTKKRRPVNELLRVLRSNRCCLLALGLDDSAQDMVIIQALLRVDEKVSFFRNAGASEEVAKHIAQLFEAGLDDITEYTSGFLRRAWLVAIQLLVVLTVFLVIAAVVVFVSALDWVRGLCQFSDFTNGTCNHGNDCRLQVATQTEEGIAYVNNFALPVVSNRDSSLNGLKIFDANGAFRCCNYAQHALEDDAIPQEFIEDEYGEQRRSGANRLSREWVHQGGYSMRGPMPHIHAEVQSSQRKEEEKYSKLIAEKREAGRNFALSGGSHVLGAGSSSSMREARQKMVRGLEADPRHRKAAEKRQAAEDHKKARLQKEEERLQALRQRQQEEAVQNQHVNDAKRLRWQVWDMENAPPEASTQVSDHELVGTWSSQKTVYKIRNAMGDLQFNGPPLDQGGDLKGILTRQGPAEWKAELYDSLRNQTVGFMRFRLQGQELVTSFKKLTSNSWGKEKRSQKQPAATKPCDQTRAPMRTNYTEQLIDDSVWQCPQCTLINEDPLCAACGYFIADMQSSQNVDQDGMAGMAAESAEYRLEAEIETKFSCWLRENGLEEYAERLEEHGYSDLDDLLSAEPRDLEEMLRHIEAKPGHILRFKNSLRRTREALS